MATLCVPIHYRGTPHEGGAEGDVWHTHNVWSAFTTILGYPAAYNNAYDMPTRRHAHPHDT